MKASKQNKKSRLRLIIDSFEEMTQYIESLLYHSRFFQVNKEECGND
ncbi:hypothetical protein BC03BB108_E0061 (plasmid) [Bacillus cereus 03BB108]|nr:hypothetical protein BC03BB108_E0061 [Bacillus cereus 03BB108]